MWDSEPGARGVNLDDFLREVAPIGEGEFYDSLYEMVEVLWADEVERKVIEELMAELEEHGGFERALRTCEGLISNGCHRLAAVVKSGGKTVFVVDEDDTEYTNEAGSVTAATLLMRPVAGSGLGGEEFFDRACWAGRSLKGEHGWLECDGASGRVIESESGREAMMVEYPYYASIEEVRSSMGRIVDRLAEVGVEATLVGVEEWEDDEGEIS